MGDATLSVVMPNYNNGHYLRDIVAQHQAQTRRPDQLIIVDDGSTDDSLDILAELERDTDFLSVLVHGRNRGVNAAVATGLAQATGTYVRPASTNDPIEPTFYEQALSLLQRHPRAGLFFADPATIDEAGDVVQRLPLSLSSEACYLSPEALIGRMSLKAFDIFSQSLVLHREMLEEFGGFRSDLGFHADWFAKTAIALRHGACYAPEVLAYCRAHAGAVSQGCQVRTREQQVYLARITELLRLPEFADIADRIRETGILPELRARDLVWLARRTSGRRLLSRKTVFRCLAEEAWHWLRPFAPMDLRLTLRRRMARAPGAAPIEF